MEIAFNGKKLQFEEPMSLSDFLEGQGIDTTAGYIAAAVNEMIARRIEWQTRMLQDGDRVELIHAVQGG